MMKRRKLSGGCFPTYESIGGVGQGIKRKRKRRAGRGISEWNKTDWTKYAAYPQVEGPANPSWVRRQKEQGGLFGGTLWTPPPKQSTNPVLNRNRVRIEDLLAKHQAAKQGGSLKRRRQKGGFINPLWALQAYNAAHKVYHLAGKYAPGLRSDITKYAHKAADYASSTLNDLHPVLGTFANSLRSEVLGAKSDKLAPAFPVGIRTAASRIKPGVAKRPTRGPPIPIRKNLGKLIKKKTKSKKQR